jgi:two-component system, LuxR family, sensor kinase FixL
MRVLGVLQPFIYPPVFPDDPLKNTRAGQIHIITRAAVLALLVYFIASALFLQDSVNSTRLIGILIFIAWIFAIQWLNRLGAVQLASWLLPSTLLLILNGSAWFTGGVRAAGYGSNILLIFIAGMLLGGRGLVVFILSSVAAGAGLLWAEGAGLLVNDAFLTPISVYFEQVFFFLVAAGVLEVALGSIRRALEDTHRELVERVQAEEALRRSEATNRAILEAVPDSIFQLDRAGVITYFFPAKGLTTALTPENALGQSISGILGVELGEQVKNCVQQALTSREIQVLEFTSSAQNGSGSFEARFVANGPDKVLAVVRDITRQKQTEADRETLIRELEAKNTELERYTYTVSHDLRSPLITIQGFLNYVEKDAQAGDMERLQRDTSRIKEAAARMNSLLNELLEISRVGKLTSPGEEISFEQLAQECVRLVEGQITARGVNVTVAAGLPVVYGDRARLLQVLQNLLENAVKFMGDQADPCIVIGLRDTPEAGKPVFFVRDNGIGIDPRHHQRIFGLFEKLDASREGTGVGLALAKRIIEVHGGRIWVESEGNGTGSTFYFTLPVRKLPGLPRSTQGNPS